MSRHKLQLLIYLSALLLSLGVFLPLTSFPLYGDVSYYRVAWFEASLVVTLALLAPALILADRGKWAILTCLGTWVVLLFPMLESGIRSRTSGRMARVGNGLSEAMSDFAADLFLNIAEYQWGGFVFLLALLVFTGSNLVYYFNT